MSKSKNQSNLLGFLAKDTSHLFADESKDNSKKRKHGEVAKSPSKKNNKNETSKAKNSAESSKPKEKKSSSKKVLRNSIESKDKPIKETAALDYSTKREAVYYSDPASPVEKEDKNGNSANKPDLEESKPEPFVEDPKSQTFAEVSSLQKNSQSVPENTKKRQSANFLPEGAVVTSTSFLGENQRLQVEELKDQIPEFLQPRYIRDANGRRPSDPDYDPTTVFIPEEFLKKSDLSSTQKQYWKLKAKNFDKILLFRYGRFYEIYYEDAIICHQLLSLNWVGNRLQVGIPERSFDFYVQKLVDDGHKVAVVEQLETPKGKEEKFQNSESSRDSKLTRRETVQILSKGTFTGQTYTSSEPRHLIAVQTAQKPGKGKIFGVTFVDITTNAVSLGFISDDEQLTKFKTLIAQIRPDEVVYEDFDPEPQVKAVLASPVISPIFSRVKEPELWTFNEATAILAEYFGKEDNMWPEAFKELQATREKGIRTSDDVFQWLHDLFQKDADIRQDY